MHPADIRKTAICTPFGLFESDDIIIASRDEEEHLEHLREVFSRLREAGLVINAEKCVFAATAVEFLGHKVTAGGVEPLRSRLQ